MTTGPTIYVYGTRMEEAVLWAGYPDDGTGLEPHPTLGPSDGGGGGGGGDNPAEHTFLETDICPEGAAKKIGSHIHNVLVTSAGEYEYGAFLEAKNDGMFGAHGGGIHSNYSKTYAILPGLPDYSNVLGTVHNHLWSNDTEDPWRNHINRYPGPEDWAGLDQLVAPPPGVPPADPSRLSVYLTDPWGTTREFRYSDRATYEAMNDDDRRLGNNLPDEVEDCSAI